MFVVAAGSLQAQTIKHRYSYYDSTMSRISIVQMDTGKYANQYQYLIKETSFQIVYIYKDANLNHFIAKTTSNTSSYSGTEGQTSHITVELTPLDNNSIKPFTVDAECDDITLQTDYYKTTDYGCCGGEDVIRYITYDTQKLLCVGSNEIRSFEIPSARITCYMGFRTNYTSDTTLTGELTVGYSTGEVFRVDLYEKHPEHSPFAPKISVVTESKKDKFFDNGDIAAQIWSIENIGSVSQINNITISLGFETKSKPYIVNIPIINGKPFGKKDKLQSIHLD